jgi:hypothetical protein
MKRGTAIRQALDKTHNVSHGKILPWKRNEIVFYKVNIAF